ncbi:hypothetical protein LCGC14_0647990 [marine sediment metagenome]|uniref:Uncharacterized protein n=1 Tax=marine sediment metagenome TaxID=412755 RepID=A0A0F9QX86_9ZZZZ
MAQAIAALDNLIKEKLPRRIGMAKHGSKKHRLIRALLRMKHSPEGKKYLKGEGRYKPKKRTQKAYYMQVPTMESKLRTGKLDEAMIKKMVGAKNYVGP